MSVFQRKVPVILHGTVKYHLNQQIPVSGIYVKDLFQQRPFGFGSQRIPAEFRLQRCQQGLTFGQLRA